MGILQLIVVKIIDSNNKSKFTLKCFFTVVNKSEVDFCLIMT